MSEVCCVKGCTSGRQATDSSVSFCRFPSNEETRTCWAAALGDVTWEPSDSDLVCSLHFDKDDFVINELGESVELISEAVPSLQLQLSDEAHVEGDNDRSPMDEIPMDAEIPEEDTEDINDASHAHLAELIEVDKNAPREKLLEQYKKAFSERVIFRKKVKLLKQKTHRSLERIANVCSKKDIPIIKDGATTEPELKKRKKTDNNSKVCPRNLEEVLIYLETQYLLSSKAVSVIRGLLGHSLIEDLSNVPKLGISKEKDMEVSPVMKTFAKTLLFYSSEAYLMVKELYELPIPPPSITRTWYNMGLGLPGWSSEAFLMLKDEIQKCEGIVLNTCVMVGEYDLNVASLFDDTEVKGHIDYGTTADLEVQNYAENLPLAQSALFFMLVPVNLKRKWKIPLAYFLIDTLSPEERANILLECLWRVYNMGSVAVAVVLDGSVNSRRTVESLGICFEDLPYPSTSFPHPSDGLLDVHVVFDVYHIIDLLRHTWASVALMVDEKGGAISWKYFTELVKVQDTQAGCSEQAEQTATWYWNKNLMRKRLIAQLFTEDVASAIECCSNTLMLSQFAGCESTVFFLRMINRILNIFNPRHSLVRNGKSSEWKTTIVEALNYLFVLRDRTGQGIFATNCKAPFVCLYMNLISVLALCKKVSPVAISHLNLNPLEILFLGIRSKLNWEDSSTASKFTNAYSLLLQEEGLAFLENILKVDNFWWLDYQDVANARKSGLQIFKPALKVENIPPLPRCITFYPVLLQNELQRFRASQLVLVHTVKRVADVLYCSVCVDALQMKYLRDNPTLVLLRRTCGGFVYPSQGVIEICAIADHALRTEFRTASFDIKHDVYSRRSNSLVHSVYLEVLKAVVNRQKNPFPELKAHFNECPVGSDHLCRLIRALTASFVLLRLHSCRAWSI